MTHSGGNVDIRPESGTRLDQIQVDQFKLCVMSQSRTSPICYLEWALITYCSIFILLRFLLIFLNY